MRGHLEGERFLAASDSDGPVAEQFLRHTEIVAFKLAKNASGFSMWRNSVDIGAVDETTGASQLLEFLQSS